MSELTAAQEREYVESKWMDVTYDVDIDRSCTVSGGVFRERVEETSLACVGASKTKAIHAAYLFTLEREEQVRQLEEQMRVQNGFMNICASTNRETMKRTTALLQRELEQLKRGMK